ncbi:adenylyltransferase and sulfurtransferase [Fontimonas thermophila]|uniref:Adenylyltransferase and sulfurtransferase n=1 Tax=Fontimonas thermophila TaxID=1076937 RepID=A0A1I2IRS6_9GAMM|nr:molybdopterin-synthase adenylyltransferase MoeB [Fontimonas thermophila]SFF43211.1 adenylyltransferase and sulfurtransferase [Fontimonas thermophila]
MTEFSRYSRQVILPEVGVNGQALLRDSTVLLIGLGGLGTAAAQYLAGAGVGRLWLSDRDRVDVSNLQRQTLYRQADVGHAKVAAAAAQLRALNGEIEIGCFDAETWPAALPQADVVLDCTDNFPTRYAINAACVRARKPLISGAAIRLEGQIAVFDLRRGGPCYHCLYADTGAAAEACEQAGILGPVVGTIGCLQALAALKLLLGIGDDAGRLHHWDARRMRWYSHRIGIDPACAVCGVRRG